MGRVPTLPIALDTVPPDHTSPRSLVLFGIAATSLAVVILWALYQVRAVLLVLYVSALFAIGMSPLVRLIERQRVLPIGTRRLPRWLAILVIYVAVIGLFALVIAMVAAPLAQQARDLWARLPELVGRGQQWLLQQRIISQPITLRQAVESAPSGSTDVVQVLLEGVWGFVGGVFGLVTIVILTFYLLVESDALSSGFIGLFPWRARPRVARIAREVTLKVSAWLGGQLLLAVIIGTTAGLGLALMGVPYFYVLALIAGIGELIPIVGPLLAAVPAVIVGLTVSPKLALAVAVFFVVQQQFENHILVPRVMSRQVGISAVTVIVALLIGGSLLGIVGAILAVPSAAILQVVLQEVLELREEAVRRAE